jgi:universal stress protein E
MTVKRLIAATDLSDRSGPALRRAAMLGSQFSAELQILHVVDDDQPAAVVAQERKQAEEILGAQAATLTETAGGQPSVTVAAGDPFQEIVRTATDTGADLVVMGPHRRRILRDVFIGTTIERVRRTGHHPVLMVNADPNGPYRKVTVAVDMSEASANALRTARKSGFLDDADVSILHVFAPLARAMMMYAGIEREKVEQYVLEEIADTRKRMEEFLEETRLSGLKYRVTLEEGLPLAAIRKFVQKEKPDLLVIGTRGLTGAERVLLGSVAHDVLRGTEIDILAVPPQVP